MSVKAIFMATLLLNENAYKLINIFKKDLTPTGESSLFGELSE